MVDSLSTTVCLLRMAEPCCQFPAQHAALTLLDACHRRNGQEKAAERLLPGCADPKLGELRTICLMREVPSVFVLLDVRFLV